MFITGTAMACPVGMSAPSACAAKRAGVASFEKLPFHDKSGESVVGSVVPGFDWALPRQSRLFELLVMALCELFAAHPNMRWEQVPLLLCLAESAPEAQADLYRGLIKRMNDELDVQFDSTYSRVVSSGHVSGFIAVEHARLLIRAGQAPACLICGVDSLLDAATLQVLEQQFRLKTPANRDGLIPGEAASAVLLQATPSAHTSTELTGLGFAEEEAPILSGEPLLGRALASAARLALAETRIGLHEVDLRLSDVTGELYGFKELALAEARLMRTVRKREQPLWHWADAIGDTRAAAGVAQLVLVDHAFRHGYAPGSHAICMTGSVHGGRAVAVVRNCVRQ